MNCNLDIATYQCTRHGSYQNVVNLNAVRKQVSLVSPQIKVKRNFALSRALRTNNLEKLKGKEEMRREA